MRRKPSAAGVSGAAVHPAAARRNQRRLRLRHLLLLLLRMAAIALLAFALARPSVKIGGQRPGQPGSRRWPPPWSSTPRRGWPTATKTRRGWRSAQQWGLSLLPDCRRKARSPSSTPDGAERLRRRSRAGQATHPAAGNGDQFPAPDAGRRGRRSSAGRERAGAQGDLRLYRSCPGGLAQRRRRHAAGPPRPSPRRQHLPDRRGRQGAGRISPWAKCGCRTRCSPTSARWTLDTDLSCIGPGGERTVELYLDDAKREQNDDLAARRISRSKSEFRVEGLAPGHAPGTAADRGAGRPGRPTTCASSPSRSSRPGGC